jgi:hypothetical protein
LYILAEDGYVFNKASLQSYNFMSFCGGPLEVATEEEAQKLMSQNEKDSANGNSCSPRNFMFGILVWMELELLLAECSPRIWNAVPLARIFMS